VCPFRADARSSTMRPDVEDDSLRAACGECRGRHPYPF
jgi:hypothetical protein